MGAAPVAVNPIESAVINCCVSRGESSGSMQAINADSVASGIARRESVSSPVLRGGVKVEEAMVYVGGGCVADDGDGITRLTSARCSRRRPWMALAKPSRSS